MSTATVATSTLVTTNLEGVEDVEDMAQEEWDPEVMATRTLGPSMWPS